jgi:hypothetical protein
MTSTSDPASPVRNLSCLYLARGVAPAETPIGPSTCITASMETVDDDRSGSLLGVLAIS